MDEVKYVSENGKDIDKPSMFKRCFKLYYRGARCKGLSLFCYEIKGGMSEEKK
jgi:hypothetical protein